MPLVSWQTTLYYDAISDADSVRYTGFSGRGSYWYAEPLAPSGRLRREQKDRILDKIEEAIERGDEPGEVR